MKAIIRSGYLKPSLDFSSFHPEPTFSASTHPDHVLVKVLAAAINPIDYKIKPIAKLAFPVVGFDLAGIVEQIGANVTSLKVGDEVFGQGAEGSLAEHVIAKESCLAKKVSGFSFAEAAALPVAYAVGYQGLKDTCNVGPESEVLIIGASGGCGIAALQIARALKVPRIVAICSGKSDELVRTHGATEVVDYTKSDELKAFWKANPGKFDGVYDAATSSGGGEDYSEKALSVLKMTEKEGMYVQLNGKGSLWLKKFTGMLPKNRSMPLVSHSMNTKTLEAVSTLLTETSTKPIVIPMSFDKTGFKEGFDLLRSRRAKGKVVFEISNN